MVCCIGRSRLCCGLYLQLHLRAEVPTSYFMPLRLLPLLFIIGGHLQNVNVGWMCKASDTRLNFICWSESCSRCSALALSQCSGSTIVLDCNSVKRRRPLERYGSVGEASFPCLQISTSFHISINYI